MADSALTNRSYILRSIADVDSGDGTTAVPAENLAGIQVLNGLAGSLYGPETPAGVFNYVTGYSAKTDFHKLLVAPINMSGIISNRARWTQC